ncbi:MAG: integrase, partial [Fimbriimonadaceae bacterium]|nr:integrase [Fimbriimonadaceae bacterium]
MAQRADNNDGSCREILTGRHAGKWRVQYTHRTDTGQRRRLSRLFSTKTEGKDFLKGLQRGERVAALRRTQEPTLGEWFDWLARNDWPETIGESTISARTGRFRKYVASHLGNWPLSGIDPLQVRAFYKHLRDSGASDSLVLEVRSDLVRAFNQATSPYQRVPHSLANPFRLPLQQPARRDAVALTPEEVHASLIEP